VLVAAPEVAVAVVVVANSLAPHSSNIIYAQINKIRHVLSYNDQSKVNRIISCMYNFTIRAKHTGSWQLARDGSILDKG
jgi:hypothetical protein